MVDHGILRELVLVYALAVVLLLIAGTLRIPSIVALIGAGIIAGPGGFGLVQNERDVELMAEIGVALLLFTAGLEFSLTEMRRVWRSIVPAGIGQVVLTTVLTGAIVLGFFGGSLTRAGLLGLFVTLSSTAVVLKEFAVRNQMHAMHGRLSTGVLLLQDVVVIVVLATAPTLLGDGARTGIGGALLNLGLGAVGLMLIGGLLLPRLLRRASAISREAFALSVLLASVGTAWIAALVGLSMAAGAFLAGLVLAESEFSHQVHADVRPLRDLLASLFFISLGMLIDVRQLLPVLPTIVGLALGVMLLKALAATASFRLAGAPLGTAIAAAVALSQVGEFSFVVGRAALDAGVISNEWWQILLGASVLTMAVTPYLIAAAPAVAVRLTPRGPKLEDSLDAFAMRDHVIILGYGIGGQVLVKALSELRVDYVVLELNGSTVRKARAEGIEHIHYADGTMAEPLEAAGLKQAAALIAVLSDPDASQRAVRTARELAPELPIIARTRYRLEAERLARVGATLAVAEELEASLEVLSQLLARLHVPGNVAETLVDGYRRTIGGSGGRSSRAPAIPLDQLPAEVRDVPVSSYRLAPEAWAIDKTLQDIDLRAATGATVLAIRRKGRMTTSPPSVFRLEAGDDIYLLGEDADILLARSLLTDGPRASRSS